MPKGTPRINSRLEAQGEASVPELLGTIKQPALSPGSRLSQLGDGVVIDPDETPPPWEAPDYHGGLDNTDARRFVEVPPNWALRWINPRMLEQFGWRDWQAVMASDPRVRVRVSQLVSPDGTIRRGGQGGDTLAWMYLGWVESRARQKAERTARITRQAVERHAATAEALDHGAFGPYIRGAGSGVHPTHTIGDGRTMERD